MAAAALAAWLVGSVLCVGAWCEPLRVLPLGDSNTMGVGNPTVANWTYATTIGYRAKLKDLVAASGVATDLVGSQSAGWDLLPDCQHEGYPGEGIEYIQQRVDEGVLETFAPDVVLLLVGSNDMWNSLSDRTPISDQKAQQWVEALARLVDDMAARLPGMYTVVAKPATPSNALRPLGIFRDGIDTLVASRQAQGKRVRATDFAGAANDGVHYTVAGHEECGRLYKEAIAAAPVRPVVSSIPDQTVPEGSSFALIALDEFVADLGDTDQELVWSCSGHTALTVTIVDRVALIGAADAQWHGSETITCTATDPDGLSGSDAATYTVTQAEESVPFNAPACRLVITEVNRSSWTSQVHVTDVTGGSVVRAHFASGSSWRGPFVLWDNSSGGAGSSASFADILATLAAMDPEFSYDQTSGALELESQDDEHLLQAAVRTSDTGSGGQNSRTFPALADVEANTAALGVRELLIPHLSNSTASDAYRPSVVLYNPSAASVQVEVRLLSDRGSLLTTAPRTLPARQMDVVTTELRAFSYSNAKALVVVTGGEGRVMASGQTAHNGTSDPAAHLAVQAGPGHANSPAPRKVLTEANWTNPWVSEVQLVDVTGGATVKVWYACSAGGRRGPFTLWTNDGGPHSSVAFPNVLQTLSALDDGFPYWETSGALEFETGDPASLIHAAVWTHDQAGHSRTFPGLGEGPAHTAARGRSLLIPNISNDDTHRCSVVLLNPTADAVTADVRVVAGNGTQVAAVSRTLQGFQMEVITDEVRARRFTGATVWGDVTEGDGYLLATGQTANNHSGDPAAHVAVQAQ